MDDHPAAEKEEYENKQKELEKEIMPIFSKLAGGAAPGAAPGANPMGGMGGMGGNFNAGPSSTPKNEDDGPHIEEVD